MIILSIGIGIITGLLAGFAFFHTLEVNVTLYLSQAPIRAFLLTLARVLLIVMGLFFLAKLGILALLTAALGFRLSREFVLRRTSASRASR